MVDVMQWKNLPDQTTALSATRLNQWSADVKLVADAADASAAAAAASAAAATAPTDTQVADLINNPASLTALALPNVSAPLTVAGKGVVRKGDLVTNVKDHGAVGDGVTDDTAAIQAAVDSLPLNTADTGIQTPKGFANGGAVFLPRGRYKITSTINMRRGLRLYGESRESSQIVSFTAGSVLKYADAGRYVQDEIVVENLSIWQDASVVATSGAGIEVTFGAVAVLSTSLIARNVLIEGTYDGFLLGAGVWSTFENCSPTKCVRHGFHVQYTDGTYSSSSTSTSFINCYANQCGGNGFNVIRGAYLSWVGSASDSNTGYGYYLDGGSTMSISGGAEDNVAGAVYLKDTLGAIVNINVAHSSGTGTRHAIHLDNARDTVITGGVFRATATTGYVLHQVTYGGRVTVIGVYRESNFASVAVADFTTGLLHLDATGGLVGTGTAWGVGSADSIEASTLFRLSGALAASQDAALKIQTTFTAAGTTRNVASWLQAITAATAVTYPLLIGAFVPNASKGAGSTVDRSAGAYVAEQTQGTTANANLMIDAGQGTVPAGSWSIYNGSVRDSVFLGPLRMGSSTGPRWAAGTGTPEGVVTAPVGSLFTRTDGGAGTTLYVKQSGTGNTGWVGK